MGKYCREGTSTDEVNKTVYNRAPVYQECVRSIRIPIQNIWDAKKSFTKEECIDLLILFDQQSIENSTIYLEFKLTSFIAFCKYTLIQHVSR